MLDSKSTINEDINTLLDEAINNKLVELKARAEAE